MRNLKKILALVLAFVMSFSLMATAGAVDFTDADAINDTYQTAAEVLTGLGVIGGYADGSFQPQGTITRGEMAALVYRVVTGDTSDKSVGIYADYNKFADVPSTLWSAGYINYCANGEIIKGVGKGSDGLDRFQPEGKVTGYEALVMILRAIGYTANGSFTGTGWDLQAGTIARERGITKNIVEGTLGQPATREMIAEILFRAILVNMVNNNVATGYYELNETLGGKVFNLRDTTGVVVANKWANLNGTKVLADGKTDIVIDGETATTRIDYDTELTDIGEARHFYLWGSASNNVLGMDEDGCSNNVPSNGGDASSLAGLCKKGGVTLGSDTKYFVNFDESEKVTSETVIRYRIDVDSINNAVTKKYITESQQKAWFKYLDAAVAAGNTDKVDATTNGESAYYIRTIRPGSEITVTDQEIMQEIFYGADRNQSNPTVGTVYGYIRGEVYAGTSSLVDQSDNKSWPAFTAEFFNTSSKDTIGSAGNGEWLKVVDNNGDGVAEYVFLTTFIMDQAISSHTDKGETVLDYNELNPESDDYDIRDLSGDLVVGDVIVYTVIDGKANVRRAEVLTDVVKTVNFRDETLTTDGNVTKKQSAITNATDLQQKITSMSNQTEYNMYLDFFGHVRAYESTIGTQYALVSEIYYSNNANGAFVTNTNAVAELHIKDAAVKEYPVLNSSSNDLIGESYYSQSTGFNGITFWNMLQPAIAHLGVTGDYGADKNAPGFTDTYKYWSRFQVRVPSGTLTTDGTIQNVDAFDYGSKVVDNRRITNIYSLTNVARYTQNDNGVNLYGAATLAKNNDGQQLFRIITSTPYGDEARVRKPDGGYAYDANKKVTATEWMNTWVANGHDGQDASMAFQRCLNNGTLVPVYETDYIQLKTTDVAKGAVHYDIGGSATYIADNNRYVNATHKTQYYIIDGNGAHYYVDYANLPKIDASKIQIHAAYAVAHDVDADKDKVPYWVADVVVFEVDSWTNYNYHSIAAVYANDWQTTGSTKYLQTLNNMSADPMIDMVPASLTWGDQYQNFGFYRVYNAEEKDGVLEAGRIEKITSNFNDNGIYAAQVERIEDINTNGGYIDVRLVHNDGTVHDKKSVDVAPAYVIDGQSAQRVHFNNGSLNDIEKGDNIIYVMNNDKTAVAYVINVSKDFEDLNKSGNRVPSWLRADNAASVFNAIAEEQSREEDTGDYETLTVHYRDVDSIKNDVDVLVKKINYLKGSEKCYVTADQLRPEGYDFVDEVNITNSFFTDETCKTKLTNVNGSGTAASPYEIELPKDENGKVVSEYEIYVQVTKTTGKLVVKFADTGLGAGNIWVTVGDDAEDTYYNYSQANKNYEYGKSFRVRIDKQVFYSEYQYAISSESDATEIEDSEWKDVTSNYIDGTIKRGPIYLHLRATAGKQTTVNFENPDGATLMTPSGDVISNVAYLGGRRFETEKVQFKASVSDSNDYSGIQVTYRVSGPAGLGETHMLTADSKGVYGLDITSDMIGGSVTVTVRQIMKNPVVAVENHIGDDLLVSGFDVQETVTGRSGAADEGEVSNSSYRISADTEFVRISTKTSGRAINVEVTNNNATAINSSDYKWWDIKNIVGNVTVKVTYKDEQ